jgi:hypothetical protein
MISNTINDMYGLIRENYTSYVDAPRDFREHLPNAVEALYACISQCNEKQEDHRRRIYTDFSKYLSKQTGVRIKVVEKDGPRVVIKLMKSQRRKMFH